MSKPTPQERFNHCVQIREKLLQIALEMRNGPQRYQSADVAYDAVILAISTLEQDAQTASPSLHRELYN